MIFQVRYRMVFPEICLEDWTELRHSSQEPSVCLGKMSRSLLPTNPMFVKHSI